MMVSNKFSRGLPPLRVPVICKDKLAAPADDGPIPYPPDPEYFTYDVDIACFGVPYVFSGVLDMPIVLITGDSTRWEGPLPPPADGESAYFIHNSATGAWMYYFTHRVGGLVKANALDWGNIPNSPPNFGLGDIQINFAAYCVGKRDGNISP